jgi:osmoprotectant transport system permease protein
VRGAVGSELMSYILNWNNWTSSDPFTPNIFSQLGLHALITALSVGLGLALAFPLALLCNRYQRFYTPLITTSGIIYTIPSLALIPFLIPITGLNMTSIVIPLVAYAQVVLIRNIVTAIRSVDPALLEVGRAMGMNRWQVQTRVVLPLALPVIVAGVRVVAVTSIGIATVAPVIGVYDLGYGIFQGFNLYSNNLVLGGAILVSVFAILVDLGLLGIERMVNRGRASGRVRSERLRTRWPHFFEFLPPAR